MTTYNYQVACKKEKLRDIRAFVKRILDRLGLSEVDSNTLILAIDEVCANLIIHAHHCNAEDSIEIAISLDEDNKLVVDIIDKDEIFDITGYEEPKLEDIIKRQRKGGLGLILVRRIMDKIQILQVPKGNICRMTKKITSK